MPDGKTHNKINIIILFLILIGLHSPLCSKTLPLEYLSPGSIALFAFSFLVGTYYLSPDLDIKSDPFKRWGPFRYIWWPYQKLFGHRGMLHNPILGPLIIILTVGLVFVAPVVLALDLSAKEVPQEYLISLFAGIVFSIEIHIVADALSTKKKRTATKIKKKLKGTNKKK
ncbi:MAG: DUF2227 family putative metal-binding protein [Methanosarcinaceae archaeon]|nr:DUF2227 family putative metal-binding protein [Methanosarcinaceae archaeon]MDD4331277.1 DUF2227 family putative metal-binding protein [Methanosarcinaceae archaeon]MDD4748529.1 DUF2227 family putative metal-binding protein [Methanosarcinaceae archaeon]